MTKLKEKESQNKAAVIDTDRALYISVASTGLDPFKDRICKLSLVDHKGKEYNFLLNPEISIKDYAFKAHGINQEDLVHSQKLEDIIEDLIDIFEAHNVLVAYNYAFVFQILQTELFRVSGYRLLEEEFVFIDPYLIFKKLYPYSLKNAVRTFLGDSYDLDTESSFSAKVLKDLLDAQKNAEPSLFDSGYRDLEHNTIGDLGIAGRWFNLKEDTFVFAQGKFKGKQVSTDHLEYLEWLASLDDITVSERKFIEDFCSQV